MSCWRSKAFLEYIREELGSFASGMSRQTKKLFKHVNVSGERRSDITDAVVVSDYEDD